jgi:ankyrin repeat protein
MVSSIPVIKALLDAGAILKGRSALPKAASRGRTEVISYLLDQGASINEIPNNPHIFENKLEHGVKNALCEAAYCGQSEVVEFLLGRGADATSRDTNGKSALDLARAQGHENCVNILREVVEERYD